MRLLTRMGLGCLFNLTLFSTNSPLSAQFARCIFRVVSILPNFYCFDVSREVDDPPLAAVYSTY